MLDIEFIKNNVEKVKKAVADKMLSDVLDIDSLLAVNQKLRRLKVKIENIRQKRNLNADRIKNIDKHKTKKEFESAVKKGKELKNQIEILETEFRPIEEKFHSMMLLVPNIPAPDVPIGTDSLQNIEIKKWRKPRKFSFEPMSHTEIGERLGIIDFKRGIGTSGFRGYYLIGDGVLLHLAVLNYAFQKMLENGFTPIIPPTILKSSALVGSGHFPFGKEEVYEIGNPSAMSRESISHKEPAYLGGTSEPALLSYFQNSIIEEDELPKKLFAISPCYRSEIGSYGKDTKGLYRVHEFTKVEQVIICKNDIKESEKWHEYLRSVAESILQDLELPYRVIVNSTGDMGAGKYKMYDIETWMPSRKNYGETHSDSNLTDWQARRLGIKFRDKNGAVHFAFTLNNTVIASPRILIAIIENFQNNNGTVTVPEALVPYVGKKIIS